MNKTIVIGSLGKDPELKSTRDGIQVCDFSIAVNGRKDEVTWFKVTAWRQLADLCGKYLTKGRKVCVTGTVSASAYLDKDGKPRASLEITADEVEFLSPREAPAQQQQDIKAGFVPVESEDLPF